MTIDGKHAQSEAPDGLDSGVFTTQRLEAFSDAVIAVIITIIVLETKVPTHELSDIEGLRRVFPTLVIYALSFVQIGNYWVNHHYLVNDVRRATHGLLWANLGFLFTLSLIPFATTWVGERGITSFAISLYSLCCALPAFSWMVLSRFSGRPRDTLPPNGWARQITSSSLYLGALPVSRYSPLGALFMVAAGAVLWLFPAHRT